MEETQKCFQVAHMGGRYTHFRKPEKHFKIALVIQLVSFIELNDCFTFSKKTRSWLIVHFCVINFHDNTVKFTAKLNTSYCF
jgi:hypothetical protein